MVAAPMKSTRLRSAIDTLAPTADLICVVSAVSRETMSPERAVSKKAGESVQEMREEVGAKIGDDPLAERDDQVVAAGAGEREDAGEHDQRHKAAVDEGGVAAGEADVDHRADRKRHGKRGEGGRDERRQREEGAPAVAADVGRERRERRELLRLGPAGAAEPPDQSREAGAGHRRAGSKEARPAQGRGTARVRRRAARLSRAARIGYRAADFRQDKNFRLRGSPREAIP